MNPMRLEGIFYALHMIIIQYEMNDSRKFGAIALINHELLHLTNIGVTRVYLQYHIDYYYFS